MVETKPCKHEWKYEIETYSQSLRILFIPVANSIYRKRIRMCNKCGEFEDMGILEEDKSHFIRPIMSSGTFF